MRGAIGVQHGRHIVSGHTPDQVGVECSCGRDHRQVYASTANAAEQGTKVLEAGSNTVVAYRIVGEYPRLRIDRGRAGRRSHQADHVAAVLGAESPLAAARAVGDSVSDLLALRD
jgi:hypothetical protein